MVSQFMPITPTAQKDQERQNFKYIVDQILQIKHKYYPDLKFYVDKDLLGLTLYKSPNIMAPKDPRYILVTSSVKPQISGQSSPSEENEDS